jgi:arylsulfatase A-like enzyme
MRIWLLCVFLITLLACGEQIDKSNRESPNIILILIDTLRPDHLSFYGYRGTSTPFMHELALPGAIFDRAFSTSSKTAPATASVMTGLYPTQHGVTENLHLNRKYIPVLEQRGGVNVPVNRLPEDIALLSEILLESGYSTYGAATNPHIGPAIGFDRGFEHFEYAWRGVSAQELFERIASWKNDIRQSEKPVFLYLHLNDVHAPYERRLPWYVAQRGGLDDHIAAYDSQIPYLDQNLEGFLEGMNLRNDVVVCTPSAQVGINSLIV